MTMGTSSPDGRSLNQATAKYHNGEGVYIISGVGVSPPLRGKSLS